MIDVTLPIPPSANRIWRSFKNRMIKSAEYREWIITAGKELASQRQRKVDGFYCMKLELPEKMLGDIGNREKALSDLFVSHKLVEDDKFAWQILSVRDAQVAPKRCRVLISPYNATPTTVSDVAQSPRVTAGLAFHPGAEANRT